MLVLIQLIFSGSPIRLRMIFDSLFYCLFFRQFSFYLDEMGINDGFCIEVSIRFEERGSSNRSTFGQLRSNQTETPVDRPSKVAPTDLS